MTIKEKQRNAYLKRKYNITLEEYEAILEYQSGCCAICGNPPKTRRLAVDHDHRTGVVRGLLCFRCNKFMLGNASPSTLSDMYDYLMYPPAWEEIGERTVPEKKRGKNKRPRSMRTVS